MVRARKVLKKIDGVLKHTIDDKPASWYLGMKIDQVINSAGVLNSVKLSQKSYIEQLCKANGVEIGKGRSVKTPFAILSSFLSLQIPLMKVVKR